MKKISQKLAQELLKDFLPDVEVVAEGEDTVSIEDLKAELSTSMTEALRPAIESDLRETIKKQAGAEIGQKELKALMKEFSISDKKLLEGKPLEEQIRIAKQLHADSLKMNVDEWNKEKESLVQNHLNEKEQWEQQLNKVNGEWQEKYDYRDISEYSLAALEKLPRTKGGDISMQAKMYLNDIKEQGLTVKYNKEKSKLEFYKDNQLHVQDGKTIDGNEHLKGWAKKAGILLEDNRNTNPNDYVPGKGNPPSTPQKGGNMYSAIAGWAGAEAPTA